MKTLSLILLALVTFTLSAQVTNAPAWRSARWGMNETEILAAFKGEAVVLSKPQKGKTGIAPIGIEQLTIEGKPFYARFFLDRESKKLKTVVLFISKTVDAPEMVFPDIEKTLTSKYGQPYFNNNERDSVSFIKVRAWKKDASLIELKFLSMPELSFKTLTITYAEAAKSESQNL